MIIYIFMFLVIVMLFIDGMFFIHKAIFEVSDLRDFLIFLKRGILFIVGTCFLLIFTYMCVMLLKEIG